MLVIGKPAEFGPNELPVRGQCQPHTPGWRLRFIRDGESEVLYEDSYYVCRQIQVQCAGMTDLEAIRAKVADLAEDLNQDMEETQRLSTADTESPTKVDLPAVSSADVSSADAPPDPGDSATEIIPKDEMERRAGQGGADGDEDV